MNGALLALCAFAIGQAMQIRDGLYEPAAVVVLTAALLLGAAAFIPAFRNHLAGGFRGVLAFALLFQFFELFLHRPGSEEALHRGVRASWMMHGSLGAAMICAAIIALDGARWRTAFWVAIGAHLAASFWVIHATPEPYMDVWWAQQAGLDALMRGESPFSASFPDIYRGAAYYPPAIRSGQSILVGFAYPPLTLLLDLPGYLIAHDFRWGNAVAMSLAGVLIANLTRTRNAALAALLLLFSPRAFFFLESGWTEPTVILAFAAAVFCAVRAKKALPLTLGLACVSKQYMPLVVLFVPLLWDALRGSARRPLLLAAALVGPVGTIAAILPDLRGFVHSAIDVPAQLPMRTDVLAYPAFLANELGFQSSTVAVLLGFGLTAVASALLIWRAPRSPAGWAAACGMAFLVFFAFNKYAACNYYFFVIAALCCAVAAHAEGEIEPDLAIT